MGSLRVRPGPDRFFQKKKFVRDFYRLDTLPVTQPSEKLIVYDA